MRIIIIKTSIFVNSMEPRKMDTREYLSRPIHKNLLPDTQSVDCTSMNPATGPR
ncbi:MAG: hypothetical protein FWG15_06025 [Propionibacteriaceae bacterium]|nr:hypothetical protein [Propionibacteriaceae bacterium]